MKRYFFGFSIWKTWFIDITPFFDTQSQKHVRLFFGKNILKKALSMGLDQESHIYIWGRKDFPEIQQYAYDHGIEIYRVEDGFIRSVGLGSDLTQPYSLVVDSRGIYFDPTRPSDLEYILQNHIFTEAEITRAQYIRHYLIDKKLSKYNLYINIELDFPKDKMVVVVPGQVEDDASIVFGANGMTNLELLKQTRVYRPDAYIIYKPHPDVLSGNRVGEIDEGEALKYCDRIVTEVGIDSVLIHADEVHTMTSLVGFEALLRGIKVCTYGIPFYAGWGLSDDSHICERRNRKLSIDELVVGTYLLYPRYINLYTKHRCEIEELLLTIDEERLVYNHSLGIKIRNWISRKSQLILRMIQN
ncbi:MAG: capsule biosynthesis protein [Phycisphaerae bacterium]|nr:capsule biosynthesis protein [Phycisphaerae bacterium]